MRIGSRTAWMGVIALAVLGLPGAPASEFFAVAVAAQAPGRQVPLGGIRVPSCPVSPDLEYGLVQTKPIEIGGGPVYMAARKARYFAALRGPEGQALRVAPGVGTALVDIGGERMFIDAHGLSYDGPDGPVNVTLYMNAYRFDLPRAPAGFTCGAALPSAVGMPPVNPIAANERLIALAIDHAARADIEMAPLDAAADRGWLVDQFKMLVLRARAAAAAGTTLDTSRPVPETQGFVVLALPQPCGDRTIAPVRVEIAGPNGPLPQGGDIMRDEAIARVLPGLPAPPGSIAARFPSAPAVQVRLTYAEPCEGGSAEVSLPLRLEAARPVSTPPAAPPAGTTEADPIYVEALIDLDGRFIRPAYLGGPEALRAAALDALAEWRASPPRINGTPTVTPIVLQVTFRQP